MKAAAGSSPLLARFFIPVCLYTDRLRNRAFVTHLLEKISSLDGTALFAIADELQALSLQSRGSDAAEAETGTRSQGDALEKMYAKALQTANAQEHAAVVRWQDIRSAPAFAKVFCWAEQLAESDAEFGDLCSRFARHHLRRGGGTLSEASVRLGKKYLFNEISGSIFATEVLGYSSELWEKLPSPELDPINFIYIHRTAELQSLLSVATLHRRLIGLDEFVAE